MSLLANIGIMSRVPASGGSLTSQILALPGLQYYFRHAEASGSIMKNEVGTNGAYTSAVSLAQPALYTSGPTCVRIPRSASSGFGRLVTGTAPTLNALTIGQIIKFNSTLSSFKGLFCYDNGGSLRKWQLRTNDTDLEWVKIVGSIETKSYAAGFVNGNTYFIIVTIDVAGNIKFYINGVNVYTSTIEVVNYGGSTNYIEIGYMTGGGGALANSYFSESFLCNTDISAGTVTSLQTASGL